jgi:hypothetical protein
MGANDNLEDIRIPIVIKMHGRIPFYVGIGMGLLALIDGLIAIFSFGLFIGCLRAHVAQSLADKAKLRPELIKVQRSYDDLNRL